MSVIGRTVWLIPFSMFICLQVSAHQKKAIWRAITKDVQALGVYGRQSTHCHKWWEDLRRWTWKMAKAQLGMASQRGRGARRTLTLLMFRTLAVAYPELDGRLRASQQPQVASSGGGAEAPAMEGAASYMAQEAESTDGEGTSGTEGSTTAETGGDSLDSDISSDGSSPVVVGTSVATPTTGTATTPVRAPPSQQPLSVFPVPAHPGVWASPLPQAPQALPQLAVLPSVRRLLASCDPSLLVSQPL
ncbi:hypothetical protein NDU88_004733 [Pleurodeles waltl]|uniref:Uncharacterized protein n=1 Tax=Pleurodeles waltl TaxID=8319 RepID=A0AAV7L295_PLEWA|nr:hypothetical protein NDU88_004733 [Pleurodeles waltl]